MVTVKLLLVKPVSIYNVESFLYVAINYQMLSLPL